MRRNNFGIIEQALSEAHLCGAQSSEDLARAVTAALRDSDLEIVPTVDRSGEVLLRVPPIEDEAERRTENMTFDDDRDGWTVTGPSDDVERVLALVTKGEKAQPISRELVLFDNDAEDHDATVKELRLNSHPGEGKVRLGWLVDEHGELRRTLSQLIYDITGGAVSKTNTDMDFVHDLAGRTFVMNLLEEHPKLAEDPLFRPVMEQHFDAREISAAVEIAQHRLDGNRVVQIGTFGTFNLGKPSATA